jgi:hypothetical protein
MFRTAALLALLAVPAYAQEPSRYTMDARPDLDWVTVPVVRPIAPDTPVALDVIPNGKPADRGVFGAAWIHVCDNDLHNGPQNCAMVSAGDKAVRFGSSNFHGEPARPIEFVVGNQVIAKMTGKTLTIGNFNSTREQKRIARLEAELRELRQIVRELRSKRR